MESERGERRGEEGEEEVRCIDRICDCEVDLTWTLVFNNGIQTRIHKKRCFSNTVGARLL